ncbi:MAG: AAA family ATPase [Anaerolineae bacterium]|nr:AAA family ATPase [Anaerolineae bacterium]
MVSSLPQLKVNTLGHFSVYRGDELIEDSAWRRRKAKSLFKLLLSAPNHLLLKEQVLEGLWPNQDRDRASNSLHSTLFILRRILQPGLTSAADSPYILFKDDTLSLNNDMIGWVDSDEFERLIKLGRQRGDNLNCYERAKALYKGDFLIEDLYEDWAAAQRDHLRKTYADLLRHMAQLYTQRASYQKAIHSFQDLLHIEPTQEQVYRDLMRLYARLGQRHQALHLYQEVKQVLQDELEVGPDAETTALYEAILSGRWTPTEQPSAAVFDLKVPVHLVETGQSQPFIGREKELNQLEAILGRLDEGQGGVVLLCGEQGTGKTRLGQEVILRAQAAGMQVLYGAAHEQEGHLPYGPFIEVIRSALDQSTLPLIQERLGRLFKDLARILPELVGPEPPSTPQQFEMELGQERQRLFDAIAMTFKIFAQGSPLVIFLEDLHAAGESSLHVLHYLARQVSDGPILILCTVREEALQRGTPIAQFCKEFEHSQLGQKITLSRFSEHETQALCLQLLGEAHLNQQLSQTLYNLTEGNAFFIHELVLTLKQSGKLEKQDDHWSFSSGSWLTIPASVREVVGLRLEQVSAQAYRLAGLASVIGREFSHNLLRMTAQCSDTTLLDLLDELLQTYLIEETETGYRFYQSLIRQVIYDELTTHRRAWLHGQVAQALEQMAPQQLDEQAAILVHHFERAGQSDVAFRYLIQAGDWAKATYATREALDHYNQALNLSRQYSTLSGVGLIDLLERRAQTYLVLSDFEAAIADLEKLLTLNRQEKDAAREGEALYQLGIAHYWAHRLARATTYLNQALELAQRINATDLYTKTLKLRDILDSTKGNVRQDALADDSHLTTAVDDLPPEEHWGRAMLAHLRSDFESAIHHAHACIKLGQSFANTFLTLGGYFVLGMSQASSGDYQLALESLTYALDLSATTEDRFWRARLLNTIGWVHRELFNWERAIQFDEASLALARIGEPRLTEAEGNALANLATDYLLLGQYDRVRYYLTEGLTPTEKEPFMRWRYHTRMMVIKGRLALVDGDISGALAAADEALAMARDTQARKNIARACRLRGEALLALGDIDRARAALHHSLSIGLSLGSPTLIWPCHLSLAELEENRGDGEAAQTHRFAAAEILFQIANGLTAPELYQPLLAAPQVQEILATAVCPLPSPTVALEAT